MRFYSTTWQDGNFDRTASVLAFDSKAARSAYPIVCAQRVDSIDYKRKEQLLREGRLIRLLLWDKSKPTKFIYA